MANRNGTESTHKSLCCNKIVPYNAARSFKNPAAVLLRPSVRMLVKECEGGTVLEVGAGGLRNALYLQKVGLNVHILEVEGIEAKFEEQYAKFRRANGRVHYEFPTKIAFDLAVSTFVIETICRPYDRIQLLSRTHKALSEHGALIISVRGPADLMTAKGAGIKCSDGYITPNLTFARSHTRSELEKLLRTAGFEYIDFLHKENSVQPEYLHAIAWKGKRR